MIVFVGHIDLHYFGLFVLIYFVAGSLLGMRPHFLWVLPKENGRARSKERRFGPALPTGGTKLGMRIGQETADSNLWSQALGAGSFLAFAGVCAARMGSGGVG